MFLENSGVLAVLFRQTNIIWVAFVAVQSLGPYFLHTIHSLQMDEAKILNNGRDQPPKFSLTTTGQAVEVFEGLYRYVHISNTESI